MRAQRTTIGNLLRVAPCERSDAARIIAHVCEKPYTFVLAHDEHTVAAEDVRAIYALYKRRGAGEPLAYLTGTKEFYGRSFRVTSATLIPRADTEILVEATLEHCVRTHDAAPQKPHIICDVGTGSGAIIITLAAELAARYAAHAFGFVATDTSRDALAVAHDNAQRHDVAAQIALLHADLITPFTTSTALRRMVRFGAPLTLCANLPYVDSAQRATLLSRDESRGLAYEPDVALWAQDGGLAVYRAFFAQLAALRADAPRSTITAFCEIDPAQEEALIACGAKAGFAHTKTHADLAGRARVVAFQTAGYATGTSPSRSVKTS